MKRRETPGRVLDGERRHDRKMKEKTNKCPS
jgi:hypothetical protein